MTEYLMPKHRATKLDLRIAKLIENRFSSLHVFNSAAHAVPCVAPVPVHCPKSVVPCVLCRAG
eukprot:5093070-Pleurochrysis_carterae.AAC.1